MSQDRSKLRWNGWGLVARKDELAAREEVWTWLAGELGMPALMATPSRALEDVSLPLSALSEPHRAALSAIVGDSQLRDSIVERAFHARGRSYRDLLHLRAGDLGEAPDAVIYPRGTDEVLAILALAADQRIAIIPFGGGTSLTGGVAAIRGEYESVITLDLSDMDRVIAIDMVSHTAEVEAGIYGPALESALKAKGLTLGHAPGSFEFSSLGGWIVAGVSCGAFGPPQDWLAAVKLATPTGLVDSAEGGGGPDMTTLVRGSEGQFGIVTEVTMRLKSLPQASRIHTYLFADYAAGLAALRAIQQEGCGPALLRLCDGEETRFMGAFEQLGETRGFMKRLAQHYRQWRGSAAHPCRMFAGFEGDAQSVAYQRRRFETIAGRYGARQRADAEALRLWRFQGRYLRDSLLERGVGVERFDVSAPWSTLQAVYESTRAGLELTLRETAPRDGAHGVVLCQVRHATSSGATLAFTAIFPRAIGSDLEQADKIEAAAFQAILTSGGTPHRGFGPAKAAQLLRGKGEATVAIMRAIKETVDPKDVLAPGRLLP